MIVDNWYFIVNIFFLYLKMFMGFKKKCRFVFLSIFFPKKNLLSMIYNTKSMFRIDIEDDRVRERRKNINDFPKNCVISWRIFVWCTWNLQAVNFKKRFRSIWKKKKHNRRFSTKKIVRKTFVYVCVTKKSTLNFFSILSIFISQ